MRVEGRVHIYFEADGSGVQMDVMVGSRVELARAAMAYLENFIRRENGELPDLVDEVDSVSESGEASDGRRPEVPIGVVMSTPHPATCADGDRRSESTCDCGETPTFRHPDAKPATILTSIAVQVGLALAIAALVSDGTISLIALLASAAAMLYILVVGVRSRSRTTVAE